VVKGVCSACHAVGALGAPKIGDKSAWAPRISQGYDTLVKHAIQGIRSMPARGGNAALTDGEVANAVAYMANQSGASFKAN
jgi:cytochrome c5